MVAESSWTTNRRGESELVPLLELFSTVDAVFTEPDALHPQNRQIGLARIYRAWKDARATLEQHTDVYGAQPAQRNNAGPPA